jgi:hypothetical protein
MFTGPGDPTRDLLGHATKNDVNQIGMPYDP